jgi:hypothetical protein
LSHGGVLSGGTANASHCYHDLQLISGEASSNTGGKASGNISGVADENIGEKVSGEVIKPAVNLKSVP